MSFPIITIDPADFPSRLREIPEKQIPQQLHVRGQLPPPGMKLLTIVGSRKYTSYGKQAVDHLVSGLRGYNIGIVSGLALGIDSLAHEAALDNDLYTLAILGGGIDDSVIYPATHKPLARKILDSGGGLLCEHDPTSKPAHRGAFPERNRLQAGISHATLLVEAAEKSGTLITARLATDYNRELLVVPGSIFSKTHEGIHQFLKLGATPVTTSEDILEVLNIDPAGTAPLDLPTTPLSNLTSDQAAVMEALHEPLSRDELIRTLSLPTEKATQLLMLMEMDGLVIVSAGVYRAAR